MPGQRLNICMVVWKFHPCPEGGAERQCRKLAGELAFRGHSCEVLTGLLHVGLLPEETMPEGYGVRRLGRFAWLEEAFRRHFRAIRGRMSWAASHPLGDAFEFWAALPFVWLARLSFMLALKRFFKEGLHRPDVVHVHEAHWIAGAAAWACKGQDLPVVCKEATFPSSEVVSYDAPLRKTLAHFRRRANFIAMTCASAESLRAAGIPAERIAVIPNGVELPEESSPVAGSDVAYVGNFTQGTRWKAFDVLFEAWALVQEADQGRSRLVVLGAGSPAVWQNYLERRGCLDSVFFAGAVRDVGVHLRKARLFLLPSRREGMSNALLEAMSWGLPAIVSDIPANRSLVQHKVNGWVVPADDGRALANAVLTLLGDAALSRRLGQAARRTIEEQYAMPVVADQVTALYQQLLARKNASDQ